MNHSKRFLCAVSAASLILLALSMPAAANPQVTDATGQFDVLAGLKGALTTAGATALTTAQETSLNTLIANLRASQTPPAPGDALSTARASYDTAVLAGQKDAAKELITTIAAEMATQAATRMDAQTDFLISAVQVLDSSQLSALVKQLGNTGTVRLLERLAGGPGGGPGGPPPGGGPMGPPPAR
jgi:hypothetical protein